MDTILRNVWLLFLPWAHHCLKKLYQKHGIQWAAMALEVKWVISQLEGEWFASHFFLTASQSILRQDTEPRVACDASIGACVWMLDKVFRYSKKAFVWMCVTEACCKRFS